MIEFCILGSGSGGNSAVVRTPGGCLLVDAGLSASRIRERLQSVGVEPESLGGILVTHEHGDHVSGLSVFTRRHGVPVLTSALTRAALGDKLEKQACRIIPPAGLFSFGGFNIESFAVPHDATCPVGFVLRAGGISLGILSDLGHVTAHARSGQSVVDCVEAGIDWIMHADFMDQQQADQLAASKIPCCPALTFTANVAQWGHIAGCTQSRIDRFKRDLDKAVTNLSYGWQNGVQMMCGTDSGFAVTPYGEWHAREMELFCTLLGMSPLQAITCGTK